MNLHIDPTVDETEVAHFDASAGEWWNLSGAGRWLQKYNLVRVSYIRQAASHQFGLDPQHSECLKDIRVLDVGCGGGVLCEPLALLGASVTGIDPSRTAIHVAQVHALQTGVSVEYRCATVQRLVDAGERFDVVLAMEVVEHVADPGAFLDGCAALVKPGGLVILSTINRTLKSFVQAIVIGEYLMRLLPVGAHRWRRFVKPGEISVAVERNGLNVVDISGVTMNLRSRALQLSTKVGVNYLITAASEGK